MTQSVNKQAYALGVEPSMIRELFAYGLQRKALLGEENVFDFSIGNPSIPAPEAVRNAVLELMDCPPMDIHSYTPAQGLMSTREAVAANLSKRFSYPATAANVYMSCGAAASLTITLSALTEPGDEVIVVAPYFPEYRVFIEARNCTCVEVPACQDTFQLDVEALRSAITPKTRALIINNPNNPTGAVYAKENLLALAQMLREKEQELGRELYLMSDEPYRELTYGAEVCFLPTLYDRTVVLYSWSKSLSLPGQRIGYIYVADTMPNAQEVYAAVCGAGRLLGFVNAPALFQKVIEKCIDEPADVAAYAENREILSKGLKDMGYTIVEPEGAFYLWVKSPEEDAVAFMEKAKKHEILLVPSDGFGTKGWIRLSYCVSKETIINSLPAFKALKEEYC